MIKYWLL